jgi:hypothetical protein
MARDDAAKGGNENRAPEEDYRNAETALGGADAVEKTSYVVGRGTTPEDQHPIAGVTAKAPSGGGINVLGWAVGAIAVLVGLVYLFGILGS